MDAHLLQKQYIYEVIDDDGMNYTVILTESIHSGHFSCYIEDRDGNKIEDDETVIRLVSYIESQRN